MQPSGTTEDLFSVGGTDANHVWAVGQNGAMVKWNGSSWSVQTSGTTQELIGVWGADPRNVWVAADSTILRWDGSTWSAQGSVGANAIWGHDLNNIWAVGYGGEILKYIP